MLLIQIIISLAVIFFIFRLVSKFRAKSIGVGGLLFWLVVWFAGLIVVLYPNLTVQFAHLVGVGRGVDVVIYVAIILIFYFIFYLILKIRKIEQQIAILVRKIAIKESEEEKF